MNTIKPIHHDEIVMYIGKRIKMILDKNIDIDTIYSAINNNKNKIKIQLYFIFMKITYKFINEYQLDLNNIDIIVDTLIDDIEIKLANINNLCK